jgi:hypothetical protein
VLNVWSAKIVAPGESSLVSHAYPGPGFDSGPGFVLLGSEVHSSSGSTDQTKTKTGMYYALILDQKKPTPISAIHPSFEFPTQQ